MVVLKGVKKYLNYAKKQGRYIFHSKGHFNIDVETVSYIKCCKFAWHDINI